MSSAVMASAMITMGSLGIEDPISVGRRNGIIAMIAVFVCGFSMGWAPLSYVITTEVSAPKLRDMTARIGFTTNVVIK